jgi:hypothetical protein
MDHNRLPRVNALSAWRLLARQVASPLLSALLASATDDARVVGQWCRPPGGKPVGPMTIADG